MARLRTLRDQAAEELRELIRRDFAAGDRLPPEVALAERVGLSRNTVREAMGLLVNEGLVARRWGVGTIVLDPPERASFSLSSEIVPVPEIIAASGHTAGLERFSVAAIAAPPEAASALGADEPVWAVERVFTVDGVPAVHVLDWCVREFDGTPVDLSTFSDADSDLISALRERLPEPLQRIDGRIDAILDPPGLPDSMAGVPLVQLTSTGYTLSSTPVVFTVLRFDTRVVDLGVRRVVAR
ncbi:GntR family transcriptional regulator [Microbacterium resistens]|uniref:GntR family transcriptional regulator n=1 Tax=Microbacterium resistens TaxID=156977 RepID=UPI003672515C